MNAILSDTADGVLTITLNRPESANALRPEDRDQLIELLNDADGDTRTRVVVLGAAGKHFCSGADVAALAKRRSESTRRVLEPMRTIMTGAQRLVASVLDCQKPVIAAVQGAATGLGAHLAYASDLVIATDQAYFAESFVKRGLVVDGGGCYLLPRRIGMQKAKELAFFGERLSAADAFALGLVNRVVSESDFESTVADFASRLATGPTSALALTKRLLNDSPDTDRASAFAAEAMAQEIQSYSHDSTEGVRAYVERRPTKFTGW